MCGGGAFIVWCACACACAPSACLSVCLVRSRRRAAAAAAAASGPGLPCQPASPFVAWTGMAHPSMAYLAWPACLARTSDSRRLSRLVSSWPGSPD